MMSLFSSFDLSMYFFAMIPLFFSVLIFSSSFKLSMSSNSLFFTMMSAEKYFSTLNTSCSTKYSLNIMYSTMICIFMMNFFSILPYNFPLTSQVSIVLMMASTYWVCVNFLSIKNNLKGFLSHCVPEGSPVYLIWLLFLIEIVSNLIRPITLTVRLTANILAGHLLMILMSKLVMLTNLALMLYTLLNMIEMFVSVIQSYIFMTMVCLYYGEIS